MISAIVAVDENYGIGYKNELLCHIKEDLKHFKELTTNNIIVMGRKTWESLPKKPLPNRVNVIITNSVKNIFIENAATIFINPNLFKIIIKELGEEQNIFIIGGSQTYKEFLPYCDYIYLTKIHKSFDNVDAYFPNISESLNWKLIEISEVKKEKNIKYNFCLYKKENKR